MERESTRVVIGIDLAAGRGVSALAALRLHASERASSALTSLSLITLSYPRDDVAMLDEVAALTADPLLQAPVVVGLDAPLTLPEPVATALRGASVTSDASRYTRAAERDPIWSQLGVRPFPVSFLGGLVFRAIPLAAQLGALAPVVSVVEVFPTAAFLALDLFQPEPRRAPRATTAPAAIRRGKTMPDRRRATQTSLAGYISGLPLPIADAEPLGADALDALAAALTRAAVALGASQAIGDPAEGCIILPARAACDLFAPVTR